MAHDIDGLPAGIVIGPQTTALIRSCLLRISDQTSVGELRSFLNVVSTRRGKRYAKHYGILGESLGTPDKLRRLKAEIRRVEEAYARWHRQIHVPDPKEEVDIQSITQFLSLPLISILKDLRESQLSRLRSLLAKAASDLCHQDVRGPWEHKFPNRLKALPIYSIWYADPALRNLALLKKLDTRGCAHVGSLICLHPQLVVMIRETTLPTWAKLLERTGQLTT